MVGGINLWHCFTHSTAKPSPGASLELTKVMFPLGTVNPVNHGQHGLGFPPWLHKCWTEVIWVKHKKKCGYKTAQYFVKNDEIY